MSSPKPSKPFECGSCLKRFGTKQGRKAHARTKNHPIHPPRLLTHRGITYSTLPKPERVAMKDRLQQHCHSHTRLHREGFPRSDTAALQGQFSAIPKNNVSGYPLAAIVLDCEMGETANGEREVIQLSMVDFLSGEVLRNSLVNPSRPIVNWGENITGINALKMQEAIERNDALNGWEAARDALWRFANDRTIIIGQSVHHDLKVLRTVHTRVIDSAILTADAVLGLKSKIRKRWGLETLCNELLNIKIRQPSAPGEPPCHDALEDVYATREVVLHCIQSPELLKRWARKTKADFFKGGGSKKRVLPRPNYGQRRLPPTRTYIVYKDHDDDEKELLRWEDVVDWEIWPKSPPSSD